ISQGAGLVQGPGAEGPQELILDDQAVLQGDEAEKQVTVGGNGGHGPGLPGVGCGSWSPGPRCREPPAGLRPATVGLSHGGAPHALPGDCGSGIHSSSEDVKRRCFGPAIVKTGRWRKAEKGLKWTPNTGPLGRLN